MKALIVKKKMEKRRYREDPAKTSKSDQRSFKEKYVDKCLTKTLQRNQKKAPKNKAPATAARVHIKDYKKPEPLLLQSWRLILLIWSHCRSFQAYRNFQGSISKTALVVPLYPILQRWV